MSLSLGGKRAGTGGQGRGDWYLILPENPLATPRPPHGPYVGKASAWEHVNRWKEAVLSDFSRTYPDVQVKGPFKKRKDALYYYASYMGEGEAT